MAGRPRDAQVDSRVLAATTALLTAHGFRGLRIDDVATAAGVAKTTIYRRWPSLAHLAVAALEAALGPREASHSDDPLADVRAYAGDLVDGLRREGGTIPGLGMEVAASDDDALRTLYRQRIIDPPRSTAIELVERAMDAGALPRRSAPALVDALIGALIYRTMILHEPFTPDVVDDVVDALLT